MHAKLPLATRVEPARAARRLLRAIPRSLAPLVFAACGLVAGTPAPPPVRPMPAGWQPTDLDVAWIGHATVLIGLGGTMILTDPALFDRVGVPLGPVTLGPKRLVAPALGPADLPPLDAVLVTHAHMDSLDRPSLRALAPRTKLLVVPPRTRDLVDDLGFTRVVELGWGARVTAGGVTIEAFEVKHWGRRWPWDHWRGYDGFLLTKGGATVLFAPDTAYTDLVARAGRRQPLDVAILGIGAYDPWIAHHADPEQAWQMFRDSGARVLVPVHWDTFRLGKEPVGAAIARLLAAAGPEAGRVVVRRIGETWTQPCCGSAS
jgi:L-ascorbate metabolism protein UlaG (beta-lactamase superfamily)